MKTSNVRINHLVGGICFLTFTTSIYVLVGVYGLNQYECIDVYTHEKVYGRKISKIDVCTLCPRDLFSLWITPKTSNIQNIYVLSAIFINQCCVIIGVGFLWNGAFNGQLSFTSCMLIICTMTSSCTYSFAFDDGTSMTVAIFATTHV